LGKSKNRIQGGFGQVFIGLRADVDGRAVHNGGRDVELVVAVAFSCASGGEDEDGALLALIRTKRYVGWHGPWCWVAQVGCCWAPPGLH
jgi:hypothetical protein